jgi:predicted dehydrogenase
MADLVTSGQARVGLIGCGAIAADHVAALRHAGWTVTAVCGRRDSERARAFGAQHGIPRVLPGAEALLRAERLWDALVIAVSVEDTLEVLRAAMRTGAPILVEKPVALRASYLEALFADEGRVIVGYNRRFYRPVRELRAEIERGPAVLAHLALPERIPQPAPGLDERARLRPFFANSIHGIDLARHVFGPLEVQRSTCLAHDGSPLGVAALLVSSRGHIVQFTANWNASANFSLVVDRPPVRYVLQPFERAEVYEGLDVIGPTPEAPIRAYSPRRTRSWELDPIDRAVKPGFGPQALALLALSRGEDPSPAAKLSDAYEDLRLAEEIVDRARRSA